MDSDKQNSVTKRPQHQSEKDTKEIKQKVTFDLKSRKRSRSPSTDQNETTTMQGFHPIVQTATPTFDYHQQGKQQSSPLNQGEIQVEAGLPLGSTLFKCAESTKCAEAPTAKRRRSMSAAAPSSSDESSFSSDDDEQALWIGEHPRKRLTLPRVRSQPSISKFATQSNAPLSKGFPLVTVSASAEFRTSDATTMSKANFMQLDGKQSTQILVDAKSRILNMIERSKISNEISTVVTTTPLAPPSAPISTSATTVDAALPLSGRAQIPDSLGSFVNKETGRFSSDNRTNPELFLKILLQTKTQEKQLFRSSLEIQDFFLEPTDEQIAAYDSDITAAVRREDIPEMRRLMQEGHPMQCSNRFGETILHIACRRGSLPMVKFFVEEGDVSIRVRDDLGRTVLHDACWTPKPALQVMKYLLEREPELLLMTDKRGYSPLGYVRRDHWDDWCTFLLQNQELLVFTSLSCSQKPIMVLG